VATRRRSTREAIQAEPESIAAELGRIPTGEVAVACEEIARHASDGSLERDGSDPVAHWLDAGRELSEATRR
jgi:hypothetical protein